MRNRKKENSVRPDMTPMIDCVFLLIIFFVVSTQIVTDIIPLELPAVKLVLTEDLNEPCTVNITSEGAVFVGSRRCATWKDLKDSISLKAKLSSVDSRGFSEMPLYIRGDTVSKWKVVQEIIAIASQDCRPKVYKTHFASQIGSN